MAEPHTTGIASAAVAISLSGSFIGIPFDTLLAGFAGGLIALSYLPGKLSVSRVAGTLLSSSLLAGFFAQMLAYGAFEYVPWTRQMGEGLRVTAAGALGIGSQVLIPLGLDWLRTRRLPVNLPVDTNDKEGS